MFKKVLAALAVFIATVGVAFAAIDANTASQAELESIKGIGPAIAKSIVDERKNGAFKDLGDLEKRVKGVGESNVKKFASAGLAVGGGKAAATAKPAEAKKDAPKADAKPADAKKDAPKSDAKPADAKKDAPKADAKPAAKVEAPKADAKPAAKVEAPKADAKPAAKADAPKADAKKDAPKKDAKASDKPAAADGKKDEEKKK
jgi:competence protein ComEA